MRDPFDTEEWERNRRFNDWRNSLPTRTQVVGQGANGTPLTVQVHTLFPDGELEAS